MSGQSTTQWNKVSLGVVRSQKSDYKGHWLRT